MDVYGSARGILPVALRTAGIAHDVEIAPGEFQEKVPPWSCVDVGCGNGAWLRAAQDFGAMVVLGIDQPGSTGVDPDLRRPPSLGPKEYASIDLNEQALSQTPALAALTGDGARRWDMCICVEVAEHLRPESADGLVALVTGLSDMVLWSAAIPGQGPYGDPATESGREAIRHGSVHINEQWPEFWEEKFAARGYALRDVIRPSIWMNPAIDWWYVMNCVLLVKDAAPWKSSLTLIDRGILQELAAAAGAVRELSS